MQCKLSATRVISSANLAQLLLHHTSLGDTTLFWEFFEEAAAMVVSEEKNQSTAKEVWVKGFECVDGWETWARTHPVFLI